MKTTTIRKVISYEAICPHCGKPESYTDFDPPRNDDEMLCRVCSMWFMGLIQ